MCTAYKSWKKEEVDEPAEKRAKEVAATPILSRKTLKSIWRGMKK
jgi:hypothetical protein